MVLMVTGNFFLRLKLIRNLLPAWLVLQAPNAGCHYLVTDGIWHWPVGHKIWVLVLVFPPFDLVFMLPINYQFLIDFWQSVFTTSLLSMILSFMKTYINPSKTSLFSLPLESLLCTCNQIRLCSTLQLGLHKQIVNLDQIYWIIGISVNI